MKEIIFWFNTNKMKNYWFYYSLSFFKTNDVFNCIRYNKTEGWIQILYYNLKILFKVNYRGYNDLAGHWDKNQYWVEDLFDNNFEEFFKQLIKENING